MRTESRRPGIHKHARGNPFFSPTAFVGRDLTSVLPSCSSWGRRMEKRRIWLVGVRGLGSRSRALQQPANLPWTWFTVVGRHVSPFCLSLCCSCPFFQGPRESRKIRWSVPTDKRVRHEPDEQGNEAISPVKLGEASKAPTFSRIRPKGCTTLFGLVPSLQVSAGWNLCLDFCGVVFSLR